MGAQTKTVDAAVDGAALAAVARRAIAQTVAMIHQANHREDAQDTDPKVGGHPAACTSSAHILTALHAVVREPQDFVCCKPHASPMDHSLHHQMGLFAHADKSWFSEDESEAVMSTLRKFPEDGEPVFQSYHARTDPDQFRFLPSGSVGIPPVVSVYTALAYRYARDHNLEVPEDVFFWSLIGDSEFREGSLMECMPDAAERELGRVVWIVDYNRQNLDGTRIPNQRGLRGTDAHRMEAQGLANGWNVIQVRHGAVRRAAFAKPGGDDLKRVLEEGFSDYELQILLLLQDAAQTRKALLERDPGLGDLLGTMEDDHVLALFQDLGGHDMDALVEALKGAKTDLQSPTLVIAHTVKGWGLECYAAPGNHSELPREAEVEALLQAEGLSMQRPYERFGEGTPECALLAARGEEMRTGIEAQREMRERNREEVRTRIAAAGGLPETLEIDTRLFPVLHTQWMWGQLASKLVRVGTHAELERSGREGLKDLTANDQRWAPAADLVLTTSPDVGTSTQISPIMDHKVYGPESEKDLETAHGAAGTQRPTLHPSEDPWTRHVRFEIAEANCMSAVGAFGRMGHHIGIPFFPIMTVYDFFIKRALDQLFYNLYYGAEFVILGTPSGVTLAPEGAQHSWKSDIQIPNLITWEPIFGIEVDWILCDAIRRHFDDENEGRRGVLIRAVTRSIEQRELLRRMRRHPRYRNDPEDLDSDPLPDEEILAATRTDCLDGGYYLVDFRGQPDYEPGANAMHIFAMGSPATEALEASDRLREMGVYANVIAVTSPDLLLGGLGRATDYAHLRQTLGCTGDLHLTPHEPVKTSAELATLAGRRTPVVAVVDGEPGLLDNIGSVLGVRQITLGVRKFSKSGRPDQVFRYQHIDAESIIEACGRALSETAMERIQVSRRALDELHNRAPAIRDWREIWTPEAPS